MHDTKEGRSYLDSGSGGGAVVGTVLSGGAVAPILGATTGAFVTDVVMEVKTPQKNHTGR